ncbi:MAG: thrombospondin type 3 repeat-containing protein, partial [Nanoarchaeota archaeon]|nr:thrombospondin type 3 repeat-containing protein [Nanoarchaeota archaeon]
VYKVGTGDGDNRLTFSRIQGNPYNEVAEVSILNTLPRVQTKTLSIIGETQWQQIDMTNEVFGALSENKRLTVEVEKTSAIYNFIADKSWHQGNAVVGQEDFSDLYQGDYSTAVWIPSWNVDRFNPYRYKNNHPYIELECEVSDVDGDGVKDSEDNCINDYNPDQADCDHNGIGDSCDSPCIQDGDNDGVPDNVDNCKYKYNPDQKDSDNDGIGDKCDRTPYPRRCSWYYRWKGWC